MCQVIHVNDIRDEVLEFLEENQNEDGHRVTHVDADLCEQNWELESTEQGDSVVLCDDGDTETLDAWIELCVAS